MSKERRTESTHDQWISDRHRSWGKDCPMEDIDTVWIEYDKFKARVLVEYKRGNGRAELPNVSALIDLADRAQLPAIGVRYWPNDLPWCADFEVTSLNGHARKVFDGHKVRMSEEEYVELLYRFRGRDIPQHIRDAAEEANRLRRPFTEDTDD